MQDPLDEYMENTHNIIELLNETIEKNDKLRRKNTKLKNKLQIYESRYGPLVIEKVESVDKMIKVNGEIFRCTCNCNVFRSPIGKPDTYICDACSYKYKGE